uniref:Uncharacterized protein n=1 Tax=Rhizophora mucronata TaxID=61149 RepID=A0A2P2IQK7_RHIMU
MKIITLMHEASTLNWPCIALAILLYSKEKSKCYNYKIICLSFFLVFCSRACCLVAIWCHHSLCCLYCFWLPSYIIFLLYDNVNFPFDIAFLFPFLTFLYLTLPQIS